MLIFSLLPHNEFLTIFVNCPQLILLGIQGKDLYLPKVGGQGERGCSHYLCSKRHIRVPQAAKVKG